MIERQQVIVIGLGVFGATIATELTRLGHDVLGIDISDQKVDRLAEQITHAVIADVTDAATLEELNAGDYDVAVVAIGRNVEATILATMQLRELGVEKVWAKALTNQHHHILTKLGATRVIGPEFEMGMRVAQELNYPMVNNYISLGNDEFVVEVIVSERLSGTTIGELTESADISILVVKRNNEISKDPGASYPLRTGDQLVMSGALAELRKLANRIL